VDKLWSDKRIIDTANERIAEAKANGMPHYAAEALANAYMLGEMRNEYEAELRKLRGQLEAMRLLLEKRGSWE